MALVLVVDDDENIRDIVTLSLTTLGYEVVSASGGLDGMAAADRLRPDLIILDVQMPQMNGVDVCRLLRANEQLCDIPVMLLTARGQDTDIDLGFAAGADDYMVKPFSLAELRSRVRRFVKGPTH